METTHTAPTRRQYITGGSALAAGGLLAGCSDIVGQGDDGDANGTDSGGTYTVEMAPVGEVNFDSVPETWAVYCPGYADMGVALGQADGLQSVGYKPRFYTRWYDELDGVSVDKGSLYELYQSGIDQEIFFEMDADVHVIDPNWLINNFDGWERSDVTEIRDTVGPFVGNLIFRQTDVWHEDYRYYSMYEAFEKVAEVFQATDRYEAFETLHDEYVRGRVADALPPESERPTGLFAHANGTEPEVFSPYRFDTGGTSVKHWRDLGVKDALVGTDVEGFSSTNRKRIDYEQLLEIDPDVLLLKGHESKTATEFENTVVEFMRDHDVASELTAVQNGRVFRGGPTYQGPIYNLFLVERGAKDLYPDRFSGELFDRDRVADIVAGEV
ncbi:ABC transporter substrate-binding protein [Halorientalis pallida]|uniref:ABC transporter substrate-binding protein n=1 Tax=Halorientalis pallida TaxID=2479928 RepID=UPI003C6F5131